MEKIFSVATLVATFYNASKALYIYKNKVLVKRMNFKYIYNYTLSLTFFCGCYLCINIGKNNKRAAGFPTTLIVTYALRLFKTFFCGCCVSLAVLLPFPLTSHRIPN